MNHVRLKGVREEQRTNLTTKTTKNPKKHKVHICDLTGTTRGPVITSISDYRVV